MTSTSFVYQDGQLTLTGVSRHNPPKVAPPEPFAIERLCQEARARLRVSIEANANYQLEQIRESFLRLRRSRSHQSMRDLLYRSNLCEEIIVEGLISQMQLCTLGGKKSSFVPRPPPPPPARDLKGRTLRKAGSDGICKAIYEGL